MLAVGLDAPAGLDRRGDARRARPLRRPRAAATRARRRRHERRAGAGEAHAPRGGSATSGCWRRSPPCRASCSCRSELRRDAYADRALPIGSRADDLAAVHGRDDAARRSGSTAARVLDVGTGSGYQAAVLAELAAEVVTIERVPELAEEARRTLARAGYERVDVRVGDGTLGVPERAPFDGIAVAAAAPGRPGAALRPARARRPPRRAGRNAARPVARDRRARAGRADPRPDRAVPLRAAARRGRVRRPGAG